MHRKASIQRQNTAEEARHSQNPGRQSDGRQTGRLSPGQAFIPSQNRKDGGESVITHNMLEAYNFNRAAWLPENGDVHDGKRRNIEEVRLGGAVLGYKALNAKLRKSKWNHAQGRTRDIERVIRHRHGEAVPMSDDASIYAEAIAAIYYVEFSEDDYVKHTSAWIGRWYPWADRHYVEMIVYERAKVRYQPISQEALGRMLRLSYAERQELDIRTIGACDVTVAQRRKIQVEKKREADRLTKQAKRRAAGVQTRADYLANSHTQTKPWEAYRVSRRTWERWGKPNPPSC